MQYLSDGSTASESFSRTIAARSSTRLSKCSVPANVSHEGVVQDLDLRSGSLVDQTDDAR